MKRLMCVLLLSVFAIGQDEFDAAMVDANAGWIREGAFGEPVVVKNIYDKWGAAIELYSDDNYAVYSPDITTHAWAYWNAENFTKTGKYYAVLYTWFKTEDGCLTNLYPTAKTDPGAIYNCRMIGYKRRMAEVDTRGGKLDSIKIYWLSRDTEFPMPLEDVKLTAENHTLTFAQIKGSVLGTSIDRLTDIVKQTVYRFR